MPISLSNTSRLIHGHPAACRQPHHVSRLQHSGTLKQRPVVVSRVSTRVVKAHKLEVGQKLSLTADQQLLRLLAGTSPLLSLSSPCSCLQATSSSSSSSSSPEFLPLGDGDAIRLPHERPDAGPRYEYSRDEAITIQLQALQQNDKPYFDHGIEVLYRYANFDPFQRSKYFG